MAKFNPAVTKPAPLRAWQVGDTLVTGVDAAVVTRVNSIGQADILYTKGPKRGYPDVAASRVFSSWKLMDEEPVAEPVVVTPASITVDLPLPLAYFIMGLQGQAQGEGFKEPGHPQLAGLCAALQVTAQELRDAAPESRNFILSGRIDDVGFTKLLRNLKDITSDF